MRKAACRSGSPCFSSPRRPRCRARSSALTSADPEAADRQLQTDFLRQLRRERRGHAPAVRRRPDQLRRRRPHVGPADAQRPREVHERTARHRGRARRRVLSFISYFGHYTIEPDKGTVTHHVEGALSPGMLSNDLVRDYQFLAGQEIAVSVGEEWRSGGGQTAMGSVSDACGLGLRLGLSTRAEGWLRAEGFGTDACSAEGRGLAGQSRVVRAQSQD